jgi:hypothetical protein
MTLLRVVASVHPTPEYIGQSLQPFLDGRTARLARSHRALVDWGVSTLLEDDRVAVRVLFFSIFRRAEAGHHGTFPMSRQETANFGQAPHDAGKH